MTNIKRLNMIDMFVNFAKYHNLNKNASRFEVARQLMSDYNERYSIVTKRIIDDILNGSWGTYYKLLPDVNWDSYDIDELGLSVRTHNCLQYAGIKTIGEARRLTYEDVKSMKNYGRKSWQELQELLWGIV